MLRIWTETKIIDELKIVIESIGHFPLYEELKTIGKGGLAKAISKTGGINKYHEMFGVPYNIVPFGYWSEDKCVSELKTIIDRIRHFPSQKELIELNMQSLIGGINNNGGLIKFRKLMGYELNKVPNGYWTKEKCIEELKSVIAELGHFPTQLDLSLLNRTNIANAVREYGGLVKFRDIMGYHIDKASSSKYNIIRGKNTEDIIYNILVDYCKQKNILLPTKNVVLSQRNIIEFVCNTNKKIGIDVTTTHSTTVVHRKWRRKDYYKYLDELWVVVVSDTFKGHHYEKWNEECPENVYVYSIEDFIEELRYDLDESMKDKINRYKCCTFHTRNTK